MTNERRATGANDRQATPAAGAFFRIWAGIGIQSFGGGATTLYMMRREVVERQTWITDEEFTRFWGIVQIAPGINLLGQSVLIGWRVAGATGAALALAGLLLPSVAITMLITAGYAMVRDQPLVAAILRGVIPATAGIGLLLTVQMARPPLSASRSEGRASLVLSVAILIGAALAAAFSGLPILAILWGSGGVCAVGFWVLRLREGRR